MINIKLTPTTFKNLYEKLAFNANKSTNNTFIDIKISGNSDVVIKKKSENSFLILKDIPIFYKFIDFSLVYYRCFIYFSDDGEHINLKIKIKPQIIILLLTLLIIFSVKYFSHNKPNTFIVFIIFYCLISILVIRSKKRFKKFILSYLETIGNEQN